jgi:hypothetical protein
MASSMGNIMPRVPRLAGSLILGRFLRRFHISSLAVAMASSMGNLMLRVPRLAGSLIVGRFLRRVAHLIVGGPHGELNG